MNLIRIGIDGLGFENNPIVAYEAAKEAINSFPNLEITLITNQDVINVAEKEHFDHIKLVLAKEFATQNDTVNLIRTHNNLSIQLACDLLINNEIDGLVTSGNTAITIATAFVKVGTYPNINKFGLMITMPTMIENKLVWLIDTGANVKVTGKNLYEYAIMTNVYVSKIHNIEHPKIGLINIGTEEHKGLDEHKEADALIKHNPTLNYAGFVEPNNILTGKDVDIYICNGYTGNIILKTLEGTMKMIGSFLKTEYKKWFNLFPYALNKHIIDKLKNRFNANPWAGAYLLGLKKPIIKGHSRTDQEQLFTCIRMMYNALTKQVFKIMEQELDKINNEQSRTTN